MLGQSNTAQSAWCLERGLLTWLVNDKIALHVRVCLAETVTILPRCRARVKCPAAL